VRQRVASAGHAKHARDRQAVLAAEADPTDFEQRGAVAVLVADADYVQPDDVRLEVQPLGDDDQVGDEVLRRGAQHQAGSERHPLVPRLGLAFKRRRRGDGSVMYELANPAQSGPHEQCAQRGHVHYVNYGCPHLPSCDGLTAAGTLGAADVLRPACTFSMACEEADELDRSLLNVDASCVCPPGPGQSVPRAAFSSVIAHHVDAHFSSHRKRTTSGGGVAETIGAGDSVAAACCPRSMWKLARRATLAALSPGIADTQTTARGCWLPSINIGDGVVLPAAG